MWTGPVEDPPCPLQVGGLVRKEVSPRRGRVAPIKGRQGAGDSTRRSGDVAVLEKDLFEREPGGFLKDESSKVAQIGNRSSHGEVFFGVGHFPQRAEHSVRLLSPFVTIYLDVEALLFSLARRDVPDFRRVSQNSSKLLPVPDRLGIPRLDVPVTRSKLGEKQGLELLTRQGVLDAERLVERLQREDRGYGIGTGRHMQ